LTRIYENKVLTFIAAIFAVALTAQAWTWDNIIKFGTESSMAKSLTLAVSPSYAPGLVVDGEKSEFGMSVGALYRCWTWASSGV